MLDGIKRLMIHHQRPSLVRVRLYVLMVVDHLGVKLRVPMPNHNVNNFAVTLFISSGHRAAENDEEVDPTATAPQVRSGFHLASHLYLCAASAFPSFIYSLDICFLAGCQTRWLGRRRWKQH